ncbi:MAG: glycosyltransferase [Actinomycetota bacterium]
MRHGGAGRTRRPGEGPERGSTADPARVLFVDHEVRLSGGQQDLVDLVSALDPAGVDVHVALPGEGPLERALGAAGATVHRLPMASSLRRLSRWRLRRRHLARHAASYALAAVQLGAMIRRLEPDVVHTNSMKAHFVAAIPARLLGIPLVWHIRDILPHGWLRSALRMAGGLFPARIVCLSTAATEQFESCRARSKVRVVYNGIRLERFARDPHPHWRARLGAANGEVMVGMIGQIARWKGQDVFLDAAARIAASFPEARFVIVGECLFPENEASFAASITERAHALGLDTRLRWLGWSDDVPGVMSALDILVHASRLPEPFGRVLVEGMAAGKPVITTAVGAGPEIVPHEAGALVPPGNPEALAGALETLIRSPQTRRRCGEAARRASARFSIGETARDITALYSEIIACG